MRRLWKVATAAAAGATMGRTLRAMTEAAEDEVVGTPPVTTVLAIGAGLLARRSPWVAFAAGAALSFTVGDRLEALAPWATPQPSAADTSSLHSSG